MGGRTGGERRAPAPIDMAVLVFAAAALLAISGGGADFGRYVSWATVFQEGDLWRLNSLVGSPLGTPLSTWSHGPGAVFAVATLALGGIVDTVRAALASGWIAILFFWWALLRLLEWVAGGDRRLVALGACVAFLGTHAGFYSTAHASDSLGLAFVTLAVWKAVDRRRDLRFDALVAGSIVGLILVTRSYLAVYAVPVLVVTGLRIGDALRDGDRRLALASAGSLSLPVAAAVVQLGWVNRWMTGSVSSSPYAYGDGAFRSLDWADPELGAVLFHSWHGLLAYHPLYGLGLAAAVVLLVRRRRLRPRLRLLLAAGLGAVAVNLYVQSAWFVWWMGTGTFGMRGMVGAVAVVVPSLVAVIARDLGARPRLGRLWLLSAAVCCAWSFLLLRQGQTNFYRWPELLAGQEETLRRLLGGGDVVYLAAGAAIAAVVGATVSALRVEDPRERRGRWVFVVTLVLVALVAADLVGRLHRRPVEPTLRSLQAGVLLVLLLGSLGALLVAALSSLSRARGRVTIDGALVVQVVLVITFVAVCGVFGRLAVATEVALASGEPPARHFRYEADFEVQQALSSYREYQRVAGFEAEKLQLLDFLRRHGWSP